MFRPHSGSLQLAAITQHLVLKAGQKTLRLALSSQFCLELYLFSQDVCFTVIWHVNSATHKDRRRKNNMTRPSVEWRTPRILVENGPTYGATVQTSASVLEFIDVCERVRCPRLSKGLPPDKLQASCGFFRWSFATVKNAAEKEAFSCQHFQTNHTSSSQFKPYCRKFQQLTCWSQDS